MARMDWEKANRAEKVRGVPPEPHPKRRKRAKPMTDAQKRRFYSRGGPVTIRMIGDDP